MTKNIARIENAVHCCHSKLSAGSNDCHEFRFSTVRIVTSVTTVSNAFPLQLSFWVGLCLLITLIKCLKSKKVSRIVLLWCSLIEVHRYVGRQVGWCVGRQVFLAQVMSPHHSDSKCQSSQIPRIALIGVLSWRYKNRYVGRQVGKYVGRQVFLAQVMSPHHSDSKCQSSQIPRIALIGVLSWRYKNRYVGRQVGKYVGRQVFLAQVMSLHRSDQISQSLYDPSLMSKIKSGSLSESVSE